ncbi:MAG: YfhO family protein, partial [Bryobacteraceae bacterium]
FGIDSIRRATARRWGRWITIGVLATGVALVALLGVLAITHVARFDDFAALTPFVALLLAALLHACRSGSLRAKHASACLVLLLLVEISVPQPYNFADRSDAGRQKFLQEIRSNPDIAAWIRAHAGGYRTETDASELTPNWGEYHDIEMWGGYLASITTNLRVFEGSTPQMRSLFGVRYSIAKQPLQPGEAEVYQGASGMKVFQNAAAFPRAWTVHRAVRVNSDNDAYLRLSGRLDDLGRQVFVSGTPPAMPACNGSDYVTVLNRGAAESRIRADMACDGMVVVSNTWYPGWSAQVDGKSARVWEVDAALQGILVPQGSHVVEIRYRPRVVYLGAFLSLLGLLGALVIAFTRAGDFGAALTSR